MDRKTIAERLRALAKDDKKRTKSARFRDVYPEIEMALAAGVSRQSVIEELATSGLEMTLATFASNLKRMRAKRGKPAAETINPGNKEMSHSTIPRETPHPRPQSNEDENEPNGSHDPAALDKIIGNKPDLAALAKQFKGKKK